MSDTGKYEEKVNELVSEWNEKINDSLANPDSDDDARDSQEVDDLIANREAVRRGLVRVEEGGEMCVSCPEDSRSEDPVTADEGGLLDTYDVARSPKTKYGPGE